MNNPNKMSGRTCKRAKLMPFNQACMDSQNMECATTHKALALSEILNGIFRHLDVKGMGRAAQVASSWRDVIERPQMWRNVTVGFRYDYTKPTQYNIMPIDKFWDRMIYYQPHWRSFPFLTKMRLFDIDTSKSMNIIVQRFKNLVSLELRHLNSDIPITLIVSNLKKLRHLALYNCRCITDMGIAALCGWNGKTSDGNVPILQSLSLTSNSITDDSLRFLSAGQPSLQTLSLSYCQSITERGIKYLIHLVHLRTLHVSECLLINFFNGDGMAHLAQMTNLIDLDLSGNNMSRAALNLLASGDFRLTSLDLSGSDSLMDEKGFESLARLTHLTKLELAYLKIGDSVLQSLADSPGASKILYLNLEACINLTDETGRHLARLRNLREINLAYTYVGDASLCYLADTVDSKIEIIRLVGNKCVTEAGLKRLTRLPKLREIKK